MYDTLEQGKWYQNKNISNCFYNYVGRVIGSNQYVFRTINSFGEWERYRYCDEKGVGDTYVEVTDFTQLRKYLELAEEEESFKINALDMLPIEQPKNNIYTSSTAGMIRVPNGGATTNWNSNTLHSWVNSGHTLTNNGVNYGTNSCIAITPKAYQTQISDKISGELSGKINLTGSYGKIGEIQINVDNRGLLYIDPKDIKQP